MGFLDDFAGGFRKGFNSTVGVMSHVPVVGEVYKKIPKLHNGGTVPKTGNPGFHLAVAVVLILSQGPLFLKAR